jgi:hypothetical protein
MSVATVTMNFSKMKIGKIENFDSDQQKPAKISKKWFGSANFKDFEDLKRSFLAFSDVQKTTKEF